MGRCVLARTRTAVVRQSDVCSVYDGLMMENSVGAIAQPEFLGSLRLTGFGNHRNTG